MKLAGIKVIIWDFDNTLFRMIPQLSDDVRNAEIAVITTHTGWTTEKATEQFYNLYHRIYASATQTAAHLAGITFTEASVEMEKYYDRKKYLSRDDKLIDMFAKLGAYRNMILTNGVITKVRETLPVLGLSPSVFELIATSEVTGTNKPDPVAFEFMISETGLPAGTHMMVGDRDDVDIEPAKSVGMHTCLVWGKSKFAEYSLPTVYDVPSILE